MAMKKEKKDAKKRRKKKLRPRKDLFYIFKLVFRHIKYVPPSNKGRSEKFTFNQKEFIVLPPQKVNLSSM